MMQYDAYDGGVDIVDTYDTYATTAGGMIGGGNYDGHDLLIGGVGPDDDVDGAVAQGGQAGAPSPSAFNYDDARIASLPRILLMGPRRGGKTSIQVRFLERTTV
jgi:hypothetical protein